MYFKLSIDGMRKNRKLFLPYILACTGMVMMNYIIYFLTGSERITALKGGQAIHTTLGFGCTVVAIFACLFLFYTNSFLVRRRKKEYGLYGVLGMTRGQLVAVNFFENLSVSVVSLAFGLVLGTVFSKFAELGLVNMVSGEINYALSVDPAAMLKTAVTFAVIFVLVALNSARQIYFADTVSLLKGENAGEKPPKGNIFLAIMGIALLFWAYYTAITIRDPISAMSLFFAAVVAVIIATYLLMISGSVALCRVLKKNKRYYYKKNHFVSVSSMAFRMKRNGAGLASICILSTMVLVTVATTACMFFGAEDALNTQYPRQININVSPKSDLESADKAFDNLKDKVIKKLRDDNTEMSNIRELKYIYSFGSLEGENANCDQGSELFISNLKNIREFMIVCADDYNRITGEQLELDGESAAVRTIECDYDQSKIIFNGTVGVNISDCRRIERKFFSERTTSAGCIIVVVNTLDRFSDLTDWTENGGEFMYCQRYGFDTDLNDDGQNKLNYYIGKNIIEADDSLFAKASSESRAQNEGDFYGTFGGLFYLGILLSLVFALAAVLIIYYKQVSEGYEDSGRFEIMYRLGMTDREVKSSTPPWWTAMRPSSPRRAWIP